MLVFFSFFRYSNKHVFLLFDALHQPPPFAEGGAPFSFRIQLGVFNLVAWRFLGFFSFPAVGVEHRSRLPPLFFYPPA